MAQNVNGRIRVVEARKLAVLETVNGSIYADLRSGSFEAKTTNGHIVAGLLGRSVSGLRLSSENGGITVLMTDSSSVIINATTTHGVIRFDFDVHNELGEDSAKRFVGTMGHGETVLNLETINGNIWLAKDKS